MDLTLQHLELEMTLSAADASSAVTCSINSLFICDQAGLPILLKRDAGHDMTPKTGSAVGHRGSAQLDALLSNEVRSVVCVFGVRRSV